MQLNAEPAFMRKKQMIHLKIVNKITNSFMNTNTSLTSFKKIRSYIKSSMKKRLLKS